jgi:hypothetical protein
VALRRGRQLGVGSSKQLIIGLAFAGDGVREHTLMALYMIERNFAERVNVTLDAVRDVTIVNDDVGVRWLFSFLSADQKKSYCVYEATDPEAIREAARRANVPADVIIEVDKVDPADFGMARAQPGSAGA